ncbi:hypothetical protein ACFYXM_02330 [Streptomyces sp. NPDC002476]|uniref:hypothetical protein n=1 Tax=Streptomyces sp. NPDC002476 TaxID=3364648 RepID=UPI0036BA644A
MKQWTRREDERLLTGRGRYVADIEVPGCLDAVFVRSDVGHGTVRDVDCRAAREMPGVAGAWSAADLSALPSCGPTAARLRDLPPVPYTLLAGLSTARSVAGREWDGLLRQPYRPGGRRDAAAHRRRPGPGSGPRSTTPSPAADRSGPGPACLPPLSPPGRSARSEPTKVTARQILCPAGDPLRHGRFLEPPHAVELGFRS